MPGAAREIDRLEIYERWNEIWKVSLIRAKYNERYIHTYIHACIHTYIHTYVRTYVRT